MHLSGELSTPGIDDPLIGDLAVRREPLAPDTLCADVDEIFRSDDGLRSVVVGSGAGAYLVARSHFHESLTGLTGYGFALYGNKPIATLPRRPALLACPATQGHFWRKNMIGPLSENKKANWGHSLLGHDTRPPTLE